MHTEEIKEFINNSKEYIQDKIVDQSGLAFRQFIVDHELNHLPAGRGLTGFGDVTSSIADEQVELAIADMIEQAESQTFETEDDITEFVRHYVESNYTCENLAPFVEKKINTDVYLEEAQTKLLFNLSQNRNYGKAPYSYWRGVVQGADITIDNCAKFANIDSVDEFVEQFAPDWEENKD